MDEHKATYRGLRDEEVRQLQNQGCTANNWQQVRVAEPFLAERVRDVDFAGSVLIGGLAGDVQWPGGLAKPCGIYRAQLHDCILGSGVRIANVGRHIANYHIGDNVLIENIGVMETHPEAMFGNGVEIIALNEAGGREVPMFNELSSQFAYLACLHRFRTDVVARLLEMARHAASNARADFGIIGDGACIVGVPKIIDVVVGPAATIDSAQSLVGGTVLSHADSRTLIGDGVIARDFVIAEGAHITGGANLRCTFVGQGCRVGHQFSSENSLFFANCEAFHGEACSVFAGPYTVTHHKSTLLIGGMFSFYNAGSGTNQSNHRYKLGPTHEGKLERGCKTGSFSYLMWPCRIGPFSVVLGKHTRSFDAAYLPFSHLEADATGRCELIPGHYIATVGTLRDGAKWPKRDRRRGPVLRDMLCFDVFSPLTVGRMVRGAKMLANLQEATDRTVTTVNVGGVDIKRVLLRMGAKRYSSAIERYLLEQIFLRLENKLANGSALLKDVLAAHPQAIYSADWVDVGGLLMPSERLELLSKSITSGDIDSITSLQRALSEIQTHYEDDSWLWVHEHTKTSLGLDLDEVSADQAHKCVTRYCEQQQKFLRLVLLDAEREYDESSRVGFGLDGTGDAAMSDFTAVRGKFEDNSFVKEVKAEIELLPMRCEAVLSKLQV